MAFKFNHNYHQIFNIVQSEFLTLLLSNFIGDRDFMFSPLYFRLDLGSTQWVAVRWCVCVCVCVCEREREREERLTIPLQLVPNIRKTGNVAPLCYVFVLWCLMSTGALL